MRFYKWAFDATNQSLNVWDVDSDASWATPQHGDVLSKDEYLRFYQGRVVLNDDGTVSSFTFYEDRPYVDRNELGVSLTEKAIDKWQKEQENAANGQ